ncbi:alpha-L-fucosidase [Nonomuraea sp. NPDC046802]|uniref:alpha-L-fucosidase n=1 Tax=Nonomuraea sp. NPDC046802 TaxID=3154919 RepID=UPI0033CFDFE5
MTITQYQSSAATFDPRRWDPRGVARLARDAGARYVVFTVRHHAGYSMYHTRQSEFSIAASPYGRDITREFFDALRAEGLRVGVYYSLLDWNHPDYPAFTDADRPYPHDRYRRPAPEQWLKVAHAAEAFDVAVSPHFLMELHVSLAAAVPNGMYVEHVPQLQAITRSSLVIEDGHVTPPDVPGIGIDWNPDALDDHRIA